ncbi:acyltransferase family protein [Rhodobacter sphaeroides]|uniref:acyltransferase family protein n=1 Tax=Cereibacter sphaeroides TaxID=1063 RepID=UPI001327825E|nr:acyltransferase family protein [Cereibacter sphaeroides]MWP36609.1 acyltransferase family protein [Cereibacter sphaeroides]
MRYRPDVDGLRSLAILPILLFHAGVTLFSGGYIGVDIFFVISGFLITTIIRDDLAAGRFSIVTFYERRARRILPALFFTLALTTLAAVILFLPAQLIDYAKSLFGTATFTANFYFWKNSGYFEASAHLRPLLHTWSLAVEEQFYLVVPVAIWAVWRFVRRAEMAVLLIALIASFALSVYMTERGPTANFFLLPTRAWELLLGSLVAILPARVALRGMANEAAALAGLALTLVPVVLYTDSTPFPGVAALPPCLGTALMIWTGRASPTLVARFLSLRPLVGIGRISYSLYLVHWPICVFLLYTTLQKPGPAQVVLIVALSFALALVSYRWVEQPFRNRATLSGRPALFGASLAGLAAFAVAGVALVQSGGLPARHPGWIVTAQAETTEETRNSWHNGTCFFETDWQFGNWDAEACEIVKNEGKRVLLWGDSYAAHYAPGLEAEAKAIPHRIWQYTQAGCPPVLSYYSFARPSCQAFNGHAMELIDQLDIDTVVLSARWVDLRSRGIGTLADTVRALEDRGLEVHVIGQSPLFVIDVPIISYAKSAGADEASWTVALEPHLNEALEAASPGASFVDPVAALCGEGPCPYRSEGKLLFYDAGHFTDFGSRRAVATYFPLVSARPVIAKSLSN